MVWFEMVVLHGDMQGLGILQLASSASCQNRASANDCDYEGWYDSLSLSLSLGTSYDFAIHNMKS